MTTTATGADRARQITVTIAEILCIYGTLVGVGVLGTAVQSSSGGALAADATLLAPATPAFSIWSVIYLGLFVYTIWQWLPSQATTRRNREIGYLAAVSMLLNAAWLLVIQQGWIWLSVVVMVLLALCLGVIMVRLTAVASSGTAETIITDGTFGLYLGWVSVATCANIAAAGVSSGAPATGGLAETVSVIVLVVAAALSFVFAARFKARWAIALAMAWGLVWIAVGRFTSAPASVLVGVVAIAAAIACIAAVIWRRGMRPAGQ